MWVSVPMFCVMQYLACKLLVFKLEILMWLKSGLGIVLVVTGTHDVCVLFGRQALHYARVQYMTTTMAYFSCMYRGPTIVSLISSAMKYVDIFRKISRNRRYKSYHALKISRNRRCKSYHALKISRNRRYKSYHALKISRNRRYKSYHALKISRNRRYKS